MKNSFTILVGAVIAAVLLSHMFLYQVRYDQVAVRTTFDKADASSVQNTAGLKWRLPWPIHKITHYSKRLQLLEDKVEELQTADGKSVIVRTYLTWRIENPLDFYITLKDPNEASRQLSSRLREIRGVISRYRLDELVNLDRDRLKLAQIEDEAKQALEASLAQSGYGLKVESVGLYKIVLPESTTEKIFETMIKTRERLSENALQEGQAQASAIRSEAQSRPRQNPRLCRKAGPGDPVAGRSGGLAGIRGIRTQRGFRDLPPKGRGPEEDARPQHDLRPLGRQPRDPRLVQP